MNSIGEAHGGAVIAVTGNPAVIPGELRHRPSGQIESEREVISGDDASSPLLAEGAAGFEAGQSPKLHASVHILMMHRGVIRVGIYPSSLKHRQRGSYQ